jgi:HK97 family phage prohead protease
MKKTLESFLHIKSAKQDEKSGVVIEGYANYNEMDRVKERMDPKTVKLENFLKNPILLFNHDMDYPVGKVIDVEPREEGLYVKARVSGAKSSKIEYIRELVLEGVLKAFSIRYDVEDVSKSFHDDPDNKDGTLITDWELQELSIVTIPCQQDSLFNLAQVKSLGEARDMALNLKGASAAAMINKAIEAAVKGGAEKGDIIEKLSKVSGLELGEISQALAGDMTPLPDQFKEACKDILEIESNDLDNADAQDVENQKSKEGDEEKEKGSDEDKGEDKKEEEADEDKMPMDKEKAVEPGHENPMLDKLDSLISIMGAVVNKLDLMAQMMEGMGKTEKLEYEDAEGGEEKMTEEEKEAEMDVEDDDKGGDYKEEDDKGDYKEDEEDEEEQMKKGINELREKYADQCKKAGIDLDEFLKDLEEE